MKQLLFFLLLLVFAWLSFNRPVYEISTLYRSFNDFENVIGWSKGNNINTISDEKSYSKRYSCKMDSNKKYSYIYQIEARRLPPQQIFKVNVSAYLFAETESNNVSIIFQSNHGINSPHIWLAEKIHCPPNKWTLIEKEFLLNKKFSSDENIAIYFWNETGKETLYIDNMEIKYY